MSDLRLVVFDVDGTLVDSQGEILLAMRAAFDAVGAPAPPRGTILSIVGLSLPVAMARLAPGADEVTRDRMVACYRAAYAENRLAGAVPPLYPGAAEIIARLSSEDHTLLGIATGKSRRGLTAILDAQGLAKQFVTVQVADDHPSKPHPAMLQAALSETGVDPARAAMIGDTSFDMEMARAAGIRAIGVGWGYHATEELGDADAVIDSFAALPAVLDKLLESDG